MIEQDRIDLLGLMDRFVAGETSRDLADEIEVLVLECFREEEWADELIWVLSCFVPGGGEHYYNEQGVVAELQIVGAALYPRRGETCD